MKRSPRTSTSREAIAAARLYLCARNTCYRIAQLYAEQDRATPKVRRGYSGDLRGCCASWRWVLGKLPMLSLGGLQWQNHSLGRNA